MSTHPDKIGIQNWILGMGKMPDLRVCVQQLTGGETPPLQEKQSIFNDQGVLTFWCRDMNLDLQVTYRYWNGKGGRARCPTYGSGVGFHWGLG